MLPQKSWTKQLLENFKANFILTMKFFFEKDQKAEYYEGFLEIDGSIDDTHSLLIDRVIIEINHCLYSEVDGICRTLQHA